MAGQSPQSIIQSSSPRTSPTSSCGGTIITINRSIIKSYNSTYPLLSLDMPDSARISRRTPSLHTAPCGRREFESGEPWNLRDRSRPGNYSTHSRRASDSSLGETGVQVLNSEMVLHWFYKS